MQIFVKDSILIFLMNLETKQMNDKTIVLFLFHNSKTTKKFNLMQLKMENKKKF